MKKLVGTFGGIGLLPGMPGTYASFVAAVIFYLLWRAVGDAVRPIIVVLMLLVGVISLISWPWARDLFRQNDPRPFVLDEVVGQWLTLLFIPLTGHVVSFIAAGFFLFRGFDVAKPWPIRAVERIPGAWGTLLDDVAAGLYSAIGLWILAYAGRAVLGAEALAALIY